MLAFVEGFLRREDEGGALVHQACRQFFQHRPLRRRQDLFVEIGREAAVEFDVEADRAEMALLADGDTAATGRVRDAAHDAQGPDRRAIRTDEQIPSGSTEPLERLARAL